MSDSFDPASPAPDAAPANALTETATTALDAHGYDPAEYDWVPVLRKPRADGWTPQRQVKFIGVLADSGSVTAAAQAVGMTPSGAYALRRAPGGEAFARAWEAAVHQAAHALIDVAFDRAFNGSDEPVYGPGGRVVGRKHRQCDGMIMFLLRKHFPDQYGDLHRDRAERTPPPPTPSVAQTIVALEPVRPADPLAGVDPDDAAMLLDLADAGDGALPHFYRQDGGVERAVEPDAAFETALEAAKRAADPAGYAAADRRHAEFEAEEAAEDERRARRLRRS